MGSAKQNIDYCSKEGNILINLGEPYSQGARNDLKKVKEAIDSNMPFNDLWYHHFNEMVKYRKSFEEYANVKRSKSREMPDVYIWWGTTGTGKTRAAFQLAADDYKDDFWVWPGGSWFDNYRGQQVAIFDEFHGGEEQGLPFSLWKKLCDRYPLTVPIKGSFTNWTPKVIIFTSNVRPDQWWIKELKPDGWYAQLERRVKEIKLFTP